MRLNSFDSVLDITYGMDAMLDGLLLHFMTENNLEYTIDPAKNATREQIRFMVALGDHELYAPCSDWMFLQLLKPGLPPELKHEYLQQWRGFIRLARTYCPDRYIRKRLIALARHKFRMALASPIMIPSRLMKRFNTIFMSQSGVDDPYADLRRELNAKASDIVEGESFDKLINVCAEMEPGCRRIDEIRHRIDMLEIERLMRLSSSTDFWKPEEFTSQTLEECDLEQENGVEEGFRKVASVVASRSADPLRILFMPKRSGGLILDIQLIRALLRLGHKVVLALKEGFFFDSPTYWDAESDPVLAKHLSDAFFVSNDKLTKNELLDLMRRHNFIVISDGNRERFNPYRCNVSFARAWKECDLIIAKGEGKYRRMIQTSHEFTRDIVSYFRDDKGKFHLYFKPKAEVAHKFSEAYITGKANEIIAEMRQAKTEGRTVMFYSGVIGSVPGQVATAIKVMTTFVEYLREQLDKVYIINPAEHFEEGMDADDLMYMWERVQRSGYIDVWRFQTHSDIEKSFELMGEKVPPVWTGKDSTYSTGCTKEMHIALDMQKLHRELQIIGPSPEKFFRRREYGVGKFCDVAIDTCE
jgi:hypothetical protein